MDATTCEFSHFEDISDMDSKLVECFILFKRFWQRVNRKRRYVASAAIKSRVYVIGGYDGTSRLNSVDCLDLTEDCGPQWRTVAPMQHRRGLAGVCTYQGEGLDLDYDKQSDKRLIY